LKNVGSSLSSFFILLAAGKLLSSGPLLHHIVFNEKSKEKSFSISFLKSSKSRIFKY
jgi:hypothetical protein